MRLEKIIALLPGAVVTESGVKRALGDRRWSVGDYCWCDGNFVFGHEVASGFVANILKRAMDALLLITTEKYQYYSADENLGLLSEQQLPITTGYSVPLALVASENIYIMLIDPMGEDAIVTIYTLTLDFDVIDTQTVTVTPPSSSHFFAGADAILDNGTPRCWIMWVKMDSDFDKYVLHEFLGVNHIDTVDFGNIVQNKIAELRQSWLDFANNIRGTGMTETVTSTEVYDPYEFDSIPYQTLVTLDRHIEGSKEKTEVTVQAFIKSYSLRNRDIFVQFNINATVYCQLYWRFLDQWGAERVLITPNPQTTEKIKLCKISAQQIFIFGKASSIEIYKKQMASEENLTPFTNVTLGVEFSNTLLVPGLYEIDAVFTYGTVSFTGINYNSQMPGEFKYVTGYEMSVGDGIKSIVNIIDNKAAVVIDETSIDLPLSAADALKYPCAAIIKDDTLFVYDAYNAAVYVYKNGTLIKTVNASLINKNLAIIPHT